MLNIGPSIERQRYVQWAVVMCFKIDYLARGETKPGEMFSWITEGFEGESLEAPATFPGA